MTTQVEKPDAIKAPKTEEIPQSEEASTDQITDPLESACEVTIQVKRRTRVIDDRIKRFIENGLVMWTANPRGKWAVALSSPREVKEVVRDARAHASDLGVNFRVFTADGETVSIKGRDVPAQNALIYRVSAKKSKPEVSS